MAVGRNGLIAALDIGTTKIACFIARQDGTRGSGGRLRVVGIGHQLARGMKGGTVIDMEAAEKSIRAAVDAAERMAGETILPVVVNVSAGQPASHTVAVDVPVSGPMVGDYDIRRVLQQARLHAEPADRMILHEIGVGYRIDGSRGIRDPRGMHGGRLGVDLHLVTANEGPIRNLALCVERCHLSLQKLVLSVLAAGHACLVDDEMDLGVTVIDMGGGTTSIGVFFEGRLVHSDVVPLGGQHITNDIARGLSTPLTTAERIKTLYGSAIASPSDEREDIEVPQVGEDGDSGHHIPRSMLTGIVRPRVEETLELVRDRLRASGFERVAGRRVVLTGGASQLNGLREMSARLLDKQVRIGRPIRLNGLADAATGPAFATCAGLLTYVASGQHEAGPDLAGPDRKGKTGRLTQLGQWLRENF